MNREIKKTFGVKKMYNGRYVIVIDIEIKYGRLFCHQCQNLNYAKFEFAIKKAEGFIKSLYKPFTDLQKNKVSFTFQNLGLIS